MFKVSMRYRKSSINFPQCWDCNYRSFRGKGQRQRDAAQVTELINLHCHIGIWTYNWSQTNISKISTANACAFLYHSHIIASIDNNAQERGSTVPHLHINQGYTTHTLTCRIHTDSTIHITKKKKLQKRYTLLQPFSFLYQQAYFFLLVIMFHNCTSE